MVEHQNPLDAGLIRSTASRPHGEPPGNSPAIEPCSADEDSQECGLNFTTPRDRDLTDVFEVVLPEERRNHPLEDQLLEATRKGNIRSVQYLLGVGIDVNAFDSDGNTSLIHAALVGQLNVAKVLVAHGADILWVNNEGETALHKAVEEKHMDLAFFLVEEGADIHAEDSSGLTPLCMCRSPVDLQQVIWRLHSRHIREGVIVPSKTTTSDIEQMWSGSVGHAPIDQTVDYKKLLCKPNLQTQVRNVNQGKAARAAMRAFFIRQYCKLRQHKIFDRMQKRFPNSARAWGYGMEALQKISYGYLPQELGMAMAVLCVCKAVVATLHVHDPSDRVSYDSIFERDLPRWVPLFHGDDRHLFEQVVSDIWKMRLYLWETPSCLDYHELFQRAECLMSELFDAVGFLFSLPTFAKRGTPGQVRQRPSREEQPPPEDPDPGGLGIGAESTQHEKAAEGRRVQPRKPVLWAKLITGGIFGMLLRFLLWLYNPNRDGHRPGQTWENPFWETTGDNALGSVDKSGKKVPCSEEGCEKWFATKYNRDRHCESQHGPEDERKKFCNACGKNYNRKYFPKHECDWEKPFNRSKKP